MVAQVEYEPGDDTRDIDWVASAQTGMQPILVSQYYIPRDIQIWIVSDCGPSMDFGTVRNTTKRQMAAELAASIIKSAEKSADRVGFKAYSAAKLERVVSVASAKKALIPVLANLLEAEPSAPRPGGKGGLFEALATLPRSRSLVFLISDFLNLTEDDRTAIRRAAAAHDLVCLVTNDRRERELPAGLGFLTIEDKQSGERRSIWLSARNRRQYAENFERHKKDLLAFFRQVHCTSGMFSTEEGLAAIPRIIRLFKGHRHAT